MEDIFKEIFNDKKNIEFLDLCHQYKNEFGVEFKTEFMKYYTIEDKIEILKKCLKEHKPYEYDELWDTLSPNNVEIFGKKLDWYY